MRQKQLPAIYAVLAAVFYGISVPAAIAIFAFREAVGKRMWIAVAKL